MVTLLTLIILDFLHFESSTCSGCNTGYNDRVGELKSFGARNSENLAQLVYAFFEYWHANSAQ